MFWKCHYKKSNIKKNRSTPIPSHLHQVQYLAKYQATISTSDQQDPTSTATTHVQKRCNAVPRAARAKPTLGTLGHFVALHPSCLGTKGWTTSGRKGRKVGRRGSRALTIARIHLESMHNYSLSFSKLLSWSSLERARRKNGGIRNKSFRPWILRARVRTRESQEHEIAHSCTGLHTDIISRACSQGHGDLNYLPPPHHPGPATPPPLCAPPNTAVPAEVGGKGKGTCHRWRHALCALRCGATPAPVLAVLRGDLGPCGGVRRVGNTVLRRRTLLM